jgi:hypothetical protein
MNARCPSQCSFVVPLTNQTVSRIRPFLSGFSVAFDQHVRQVEHLKKKRKTASTQVCGAARRPFHFSLGVCQCNRRNATKSNILLTTWALAFAELGT